MKKTKELLNTRNIIADKKIELRGGSFIYNINQESDLLKIFGGKNKDISRKEQEEYKKNKEKIFEYMEELGIDYKNFSSSFEKGLIKMLKAFERDGSYVDIKDIGYMYALYVRSTLKNFINKKSKDIQLILDQIEKPHLLKTNSFFELKEKYKEDEFIDNNIIRRFFINNSRNPEQAIENAKKQYMELKKEYEGDEFITEGMIKTFVMSNPRNPEQAIENAKKQYMELKKEYEGDEFITEGMIKILIVVNPKNIKKTIQRIKEEYEILKKEYEGNLEVKDRMIRYALIRTPKNIKETINKIIASELNNGNKKYTLEENI